MRAAVYYANSDLRFDDVPEPTVRPGTVKVNLSRNGICGADLYRCSTAEDHYDIPLSAIVASRLDELRAGRRIALFLDPTR